MYHLTIPPAFARDREGRELNNGNGRWTSKGFQTELTAEQAEELWSDADYYSDPTDMDLPLGLYLSARATLRALAVAGYQPKPKKRDA